VVAVGKRSEVLISQSTNGPVTVQRDVVARPGR
jgi:hypothetical protein